MSNQKNLTTRGIVGIGSLLLLGFFLRAYHLTAWSFWIDEAFSVKAATLRSVREVCSFDTGQPPLYHLMMNVVGRTGHFDEVALRLPSVVAGTLSLLALFLLGRVLLPLPQTGVAVLLLALSPYAILISREARSHAFIFLWNCFACVCLSLAFKRQQVRWLLGFGIFAVLSFYSHYEGGMTLAAGAVCSLWCWRHLTPALRRSLILTFVLCGVSCLPVFFLAHRAATTNALFAWNFQWIKGFAAVLITLVDFPFAYTSILLWTPGWEIFVFLGSLFTTLLLGLGIRKVKAEVINYRILLAFLFIPFILMTLLALTTAVHSPKYFALSLPAYLLLVAMGWFTFHQRWPLIGGSFAVLVLSLELTTLVAMYHSPTCATADWRGAVHWIDQQRTSHDAVIVPEWYTKLLDSYTSKPCPVVESIGNRFIDREGRPVSPPRISRCYERIWVISFDNKKEPKLSRDYLLGSERCSPIRERIFHGLAVRLYPLRSEGRPLR